jgi:hypothetical protein
MMPPHPGQVARLPAISSRARKRFPHAQTTEIDM